MAKIKTLCIALILLFLGGTAFGYAGSTGRIPDMESLRALKEFMARFGSIVAQIELSQGSEASRDWAAIQKDVAEMNRIFKDLKSADKKGLYKPYFDELAVRLKDLTSKAGKKSQAFEASFEKLTDTCFHCHAAHRPNDLTVPKKQQLSLK